MPNTERMWAATTTVNSRKEKEKKSFEVGSEMTSDTDPINRRKERKKKSRLCTRPIHIVARMSPANDIVMPDSSYIYFKHTHGSGPTINYIFALFRVLILCARARARNYE